MRVQACAATSKHLSLRHCMPLHPERGGGLEATHHRETNPARHPKVIKGLAQHLKSGPTITSHSLQK